MLGRLRQKYISHPLQGALAHGLFQLIRLMPFERASGFGGWLARKIGPKTGAHKIARDNLKRAFPDKTDVQINEILTATWDNLGRTTFEFPHVGGLDIYAQPDRFEVVNGHYIDQLRDDGKCGIFFSGHFANWELCALALAHRTPALAPHLIYREPDNPYVRQLFQERKPSEESGLIPKGVKGARQALQILKDGGHLAMLVDQKMNDGIAVPFFGRDAMTAPAIAQFALKFDCPVVPTQIERLDGTRFRITFYEPMDLPKTGNRQEDILAIMTQINAMLEDWVRQHPDQWLWMHRRWPKN